MKHTKFLAIGVMAMAVGFSAHADNGQNIYGEFENSNNTNLETPAFIKDTGSFFSKIGSSLKSGVQSATISTGQVIQKTGKGIQNLAQDFSGEQKQEVKENKKVEPVALNQNKEKSVSNMKKIRDNGTKKTNKNDKITNHIF